MSIAQTVLYAWLKVVVRLFFKLYYPKTLVLGKAYFRLEGPTLVISNHPNTLIDPLNAAFRVSSPVYFLANASLFKKPVAAKILRFLYSIPIERPKDTHGRPIDNKASFEACVAHLKKGRHLYVAPEGESQMERRLRPLRTGTARIALTAENASDFSLGVRILPLGFTYSAPAKSGTSLVVHAGPPILASEWGSVFRTDPRAAIKGLTEQMEKAMRSLLINAHNGEEDRMLACWENRLQVESPLPQEKEFARSRQLLKAVRAWKGTKTSKLLALRVKTSSYQDLLYRLGVAEKALAALEVRTPFSYFLASLYWLPFWFAGWLTHAVPVAGIKKLFLLLQIDPEYQTTFKWMGGLVLMPLWYGFLLLACFLTGLAPFWLVLPSLIASGYFYMLLKPRWKELYAIAKGAWIRSTQPEHLEKWRKARKEIMELLSDAL
ncbi:MAG: 1-acyl-sn-glycerol-3-phosphate acyltransferase [Haliscomenobacter sp.]|nr:1-acyl-sn-glycerol-3-phosphate acyltransferase [Haliscomenobacter sp.]